MEDTQSNYQLRGASDSRDLLTQSGTVLRMRQVEFEEAGVSTVQFGVIPPVSGAPFSCVATIRWSEQGNKIERQVDIVNGVMVSAQGRYLDISIEDTTPNSKNGGEVPGAGSQYTVTYLASRRPRPCQGRPPTLYGGTGTLNPTAEPDPITTLTFDIPQNVGVISVAVYAMSTANPAISPNIAVEAEDSAGNVWAAWQQGQVPVGFVALPPGATKIVVTDEDATHGDLITVIWGIDG